MKLVKLHSLFYNFYFHLLHDTVSLFSAVKIHQILCMITIVVVDYVTLFSICLNFFHPSILCLHKWQCCPFFPLVLTLCFNFIEIIVNSYYQQLK